MKDYQEQFNFLVKSQSSEYGIANARLWAEIDPNYSSQLAEAVPIIKNIIKMICASPSELIGKCFNITSIISIALCDAGIKHIVTVGDVTINGVPYFNVTKESLYRSFCLGYEETKKLDAHAWITLSCGTIIDATILSSIAHHKFKKRLKFNQSLYISNLPSKYAVVHQPMILGPMFGIRTNWERSEMAVMQAHRWIISINTLLSDQ